MIVVSELDVTLEGYCPGDPLGGTTDSANKGADFPMGNTIDGWDRGLIKELSEVIFIGHLCVARKRRARSHQGIDEAE